MTREQQIAHGRLWQVSPNGEPANILHEGSRSDCLKWIRENHGRHAYTSGKIRLGQLIWEHEPEPVKVKESRDPSSPLKEK